MAYYLLSEKQHLLQLFVFDVDIVLTLGVCRGGSFRLVN